MFRDPLSMRTRPTAAMTAPTFTAPQQPLRPRGVAIAVAPGVDGRLLLTLSHRHGRDKLWVDARHHADLHRVATAVRSTARATATATAAAA